MLPGDSCPSTVATQAFHDACCGLVGPASADAAATVRFGLLASPWCNACRGSPPANPWRAVCHLLLSPFATSNPFQRKLLP